MIPLPSFGFFSSRQPIQKKKREGTDAFPGLLQLLDLTGFEVNT